MKLATVVSIFAGIAAVDARCFSDLGDQWDQGYYAALVTVDRLCDSGLLSGHFNASEIKYGCNWLDIDLKGEFVVTFNGKQPMTGDLHPADCVKYLRREVEGCAAGGSSTHGNFTFTADVNQGYCPEIQVLPIVGSEI